VHRPRQTHFSHAQPAAPARPVRRRLPGLAAARSNAPPYAESCLAVYGRDSGGHIQATLRQRERGGIRYRFPPADAAAVAALQHRRRRNAGREVGSCPLPAVGQHDRITAHPDNAARVTQARQLLCGAGRPERDRRTPIAAEGAEISQFARDVRQEPALTTQPRRLACPSPRGTCGRCPAEVFGWAQIVMIRQPLLAGREGRRTASSTPACAASGWTEPDAAHPERPGTAAPRSAAPPRERRQPGASLAGLFHVEHRAADPHRPVFHVEHDRQKRQSPANRALQTTGQGALSGAAGWPARRRCPSGSSAAR